ncbi:MAG TPA: hypothetical protein VM163_13985 [bacterium]|nr:hypothetical protein [bacterium]
MNIVIIPTADEPDAYDLWVNERLFVAAETMQVCDNIKQSLERGPTGDTYSEADEVADHIKTQQEGR